MKRTTSLLTTGALGLGAFAALGTIAPGVASASGCGVTTLDLAGLEAAFAGALTGVDDGATAEMLSDGLHLTMPSAEEDPDSLAYASWFMDGLEIPLAGATAQSNFDLATTLAPGQPVANHPTYELYVDLDGPAADDPAQAILVYWEPDAGPCGRSSSASCGWPPRSSTRPTGCAPTRPVSRSAATRRPARRWS